MKTNRGKLWLQSLSRAHSAPQAGRQTDMTAFQHPGQFNYTPSTSRRGWGPWDYVRVIQGHQRQESLGILFGDKDPKTNEEGRLHSQPTGGKHRLTGLVSPWMPGSLLRSCHTRVSPDLPISAPLPLFWASPCRVPPRLSPHPHSRAISETLSSAPLDSKTPAYPFVLSSPSLGPRQDHTKNWRGTRRLEGHGRGGARAGA